ncbi:putative peptidyl-prolyl cis-trans isomerase Cbf2 [Andreprevotia sp. IGB-42]|uniref:peptidylprolyl isomerase n=1 Tax=Andreprevotia sp. IGB-42 TaxID=2497473 RepID=UPI0013574F92|nr:peptidylprolyl isomerase [Andreprevotia sp. IGB-42]KAF0814926.1 putative peptidyl-prolyl cis-trans isomerase Cbf2 [Andreprevotia sp. IGB-42]
MTITVNGVEISDARIDAELPHFEGTPSPRDAATQQLILHELLLQTAAAQGITGETEDEKIGNLLESAINVAPADEAACRAFYEQNPQSFVRGEQVEASHILFSADDGVPASLVRAKAEGILNELKAEPYKFEAYAREHSTCPSGKQGGSLGQFGRGQMVPEFDAAAFALGEGELSPELVETQFGFHIIKAGKKTAGESVAFDQVQERLQQYLTELASRQAMNDYLGGLVKGAKIEGYQLEA